MKDWISVDDRLPEDGIHVLIFTKRFETKHIANYSCKAGEWSHGSRQVWNTSEITNWMPLPDDPK